MRPLERIPLHDHANRNAGGPLHGPSVSGLVGGGSPTSTTTYATLPPGTTPGTSLIWDGSTWREGSTMVPYYIDTGETFTVPLYRQALFSEEITGPGLLVVTGMLIEVD